MAQAAQTRVAKSIPSPGLILVAGLLIVAAVAIIASLGRSSAVDYSKFAPTPSKVSISAPVQSVAFSSDGRTVLIGGADGSVSIWNTQNTTPKLFQVRHSGPVNALAFAPDGSILASGGDDDQVILWKAATGERVNSVKQADPVNSVAFSADGKLLASSAASGRLYLWDTKTWNSIPFPGDGRIASVAFAPKGDPNRETLATGGTDGAVTLWDLPGGVPRQLQKRHSDSVNCLAFSVDGKMLAAAGGGSDLQVAIWNADREGGRWELKQTLKQTKKVDLVAFSPDGKTLAMKDESGEFRLLDTEAWMGKPFLWSSNVKFFSFSQNSKVLLVTGSEIQIWAHK